MVDENTLRNSFRAIKADMLKLEGEMLSFQEQLGDVLFRLEKLSSKPKKKSRKKAVKKKLKKK